MGIFSIIINLIVLFYLNSSTLSAPNPISTCIVYCSVLWSYWIIEAMFLSHVWITVTMYFSTFCWWGCSIKSALNTTFLYMYCLMTLFIYTYDLLMCRYPHYLPTVSHPPHLNSQLSFSSLIQLGMKALSSLCHVLNLKPQKTFSSNFLL